MNDITKSIIDFYDNNHFPGPYTIKQLTEYSVHNNRYLSIIEKYMKHDIKVLDVGCGTGFISNLFALKYHSNFVGIDFSSAADVASQFACDNNITNAHFLKQDLFDYKSTDQYDIIIGMSVLTHVPDYIRAIEYLKSFLAPGGIMIIGLYNTYGNWAKRNFKINFNNSRLKLDQISNPYEVTLTNQQVLALWPDYKLIEAMPSFYNHGIDFYNIFNGKNGGLTVYVFQQSQHE